MTIKLVTGLPGSGKSTLLVDEACKLREVNAGTEAPPRPIYACGIDGLSDDLALPLATPMDWQNLPDGSIVLVDEVWKYWPAKGPAAKEPPEVLMLAEHRHRGFDFIIATQHPSQISVFVRNLCGAHIHLKRKFGTHIVRRVEWGEVVTDLQSESKWALGVSGPWTFPKDRWKYFKSASLHTVKRTIPKRAYFLLAAVLALPVLGWIAYHRLKSLSHPGHYKGQNTAQQGQGAQAGLSVTGGQHVVLTPEQWVEERTPRVAGVPWSAPMWDGLKPTTTPDLLCAIVEREDGTRDCRCMTEQITPVDVDQMTCYRAATDGVYNPYRAQERQDTERGRRPEAQDAQRPATVAGGWASGGWPAGVGAQTYTPPGEPGSWNPDALTSGSR